MLVVSSLVAAPPSAVVWPTGSADGGRSRVVALVFLLGIAGATASPDIEVPVVSRIVLGVAVGAASVAVPL